MRLRILLVTLCLAGLSSACAGAGGTAGSEPTGSASAPVVTASDSPGGQTRTPVESGTLSSVSGVDGDTIRLPDGASVRLIGVDTPERGQQCYAEASARTAELIAAGVVLQLPAGHEDSDRYGRLLRYVELADGSDLGTILLQEGLANARYDSVDGYGHHPREEEYRRISTATEHQCPELDSTQTATSNSNSTTTGSGCDPGYGGGCVPLRNTDLDCSDLDFPVIVKGEDPHHLDADGNGIGCESN